MCSIINLYIDMRMLMYARLIKSRRIKWAGHVARMVEKSNVQGLCRATENKDASW